MKKRNIVVIGASTGGFEAIRQLIARLPADLDAAIFIVWHMSPDVTGILPQLINRQKTILATNAVDKEPIVMNRVYVAPPDRHLLLEQGVVRVTRGPKENRFRPAVDPLFRSAAYMYGPRVVGIVLSGGLDDGTAGLWAIKHRGGLAIVQQPEEAEVPSMPENALAAVQVDYCLSIAEIAALLVKLTAEPIQEVKQEDMKEQEKTEIEVRIALQDQALEQGVMKLGHLSPYACPECHGVLSAIQDGDIIRYRCHTGHAYSANSLLTSITENIEDSLWGAIRGVEESMILLNNLGDHYAENNQPKLAAMYFKKAQEAESRANIVRQAVLNHEQLTNDRISRQATEEDLTSSER
ncbi:chemotaxis protein CheB [Adhaeribacter arboris]|uniref:protein-glutamate methylesterase n=1 Tax=Adhaeribacter arboris TaxID=2072846 RepID=A0A2T2YK95_9BACT|nr:chemotaxis protein CheB [Adhaeribacter arboris]PSR55931.1 chemotaxis protein CheB [Adhaeribacter arboris]